MPDALPRTLSRYVGELPDHYVAMLAEVQRHNGILIRDDKGWTFRDIPPGSWYADGVVVQALIRRGFLEVLQRNEQHQSVVVQISASPGLSDDTRREIDGMRKLGWSFERIAVNMPEGVKRKDVERYLAATGRLARGKA